MILRLFFFLLFSLSIDAKEFTLATYNVENLFDVKRSGQEYKEYEPLGASGWSEKMLAIKIKHLAKIIKRVDADILALQELENKEVLKRLNLALGRKKYPYMYIPLQGSITKNALLSRFPIKGTKRYSLYNRFRSIHEVTLSIEGKSLLLYLNHWPSYKHQSIRIEYAKKLLEILKTKREYIIIGDLNSPFKKRKNTWGKAHELLNSYGYNLWLEEPYKRRYSHSFFGKKSAIDHIILSKKLLKNYIPHSFGHIAPGFAVDKKGNPLRWQISNKGKGKHLGRGYSDHLPLRASLTTQKIAPQELKKVEVKRLYSLENGRVDYILKDVMVVDKKYYGVSLEDKRQNRIFFYRPPQNFELGKVYSLHVKELGEYKGKKEIIAGVILKN